MAETSRIVKELYRTGIVIIVSYLFVSLNSSFNPLDSYYICPRGNVSFLNIVVVLQLSLLLSFVRLMFNMTSKMENEKLKLFLYPLVIFALPVSIILMWLQYLGC